MKTNVFNSTPTAEVVSLYLAMRERHRERLNLPRLKAALIAGGDKINTKDYEAYWSALAQQGLGVVIRGPRGALRWFHWKTTLKEVQKLINKQEERDLRTFSIHLLLKGTSEAIINAITGLRDVECAALSKDFVETNSLTPIKVDEFKLSH
jgi:hypothetical protein